MSLRELARLSKVSNAYLSQVERDLHEPSLRVLNAVADVLSIPVESLVSHGRGGSEDHPQDATVSVEEAIRADPRLSKSEKQALLGVYRSYLAQADR